ncbi:hypothetical protein [Kaistella soli]|uniref:hypothetical protein n=1 Tax=Kaistella soli TaxID=2849654 RepID=UPI001FE68C99|nr:hypothetical protein [Kaistella soli]
MKFRILKFALLLNTALLSSQTTQTRDNAGLQGDQGATSGFFQTANPINYPSGAAGWWHLLDVRHSEPSNNYAMQFSGSFSDQNLYFRKTDNVASQPWRKVLMEDSVGRVGIGTNSLTDLLTISGTHTNSTFLLHADIGGNPGANLTLWASEPLVTYSGVGVGNNIRNFYNGQAFSRINPTQGGSYMRLLENEVTFNLVSETGAKKQTLSVLPSGIDIQGYVHADGGGLLSARAGDIGGALTLLNNFKTGSQYNSWVIYNMAGGYGNSLQFWNYSADGTKSVPRLKLSDDGDMALYGKFEAKEVKVTTTPTADFVFEETYELPELEEVEKHIKEKKHLPQIASAAEMERDGVNVGEFQIKLLQKIEELTLYTIEQSKMIKKQSERIEKLEKQLSPKK